MVVRAPKRCDQHHSDQHLHKASHGSKDCVQSFKAGYLVFCDARFGKEYLCWNLLFVEVDQKKPAVNGTPCTSFRVCRRNCCVNDWGERRAAGGE